MKALFLAALLLAGAAQASDFTFAAATDGSYTCSTYCTGFATSDPAHTVGFVNIQPGTVQLVGGTWQQSHTYTLSVDGVSHRALNVFQPFTVDELTISVTYTSHTTCVRSGRGQHCTTFNQALAGHVSGP